MVNRRKTVKKILPIIAVVVLLMLFMAPAASAAPPAWGGGDCGGSYHCASHFVRSVYRAADVPEQRYSVIGFRLVRQEKQH